MILVLEVTEKKDAVRMESEIRKAVRKWNRILKKELGYRITITFRDNDNS